MARNINPFCNKILSASSTLPPSKAVSAIFIERFLIVCREKKISHSTCHKNRIMITFRGNLKYFGNIYHEHVLHNLNSISVQLENTSYFVARIKRHANQVL